MFLKISQHYLPKIAISFKPKITERSSETRRRVVDSGGGHQIEQSIINQKVDIATEG